MILQQGACTIHKLTFIERKIKIKELSIHAQIVYNLRNNFMKSVRFTVKILLGNRKQLKIIADFICRHK